MYSHVQLQNSIGLTQTRRFFFTLKYSFTQCSSMELQIPYTTVSYFNCQAYLKVYEYSQLSPCGHPAITDTPLLRTVCKSPAETTMKCIEITLAITDSRYYGIADTSCSPEQTFLLLYSRYNGHLGRIFLWTQYESE